MSIKKGDCMKKHLLLLLAVFALSACSNDNLEQQEQSVQENNQTTIESANVSESSSNTTDTSSEESTNSEDVSQDTEQMVRQFIEDMYMESNPEDYRNVDEIVSEDFKGKMHSQSAETDSDEDMPDTEIGTQNIEIYKSTSNRDDEYIYILDLEVINHDIENIAKSQRIGKVKMIEESDTLKINSVEELSNKEINE